MGRVRRLGGMPQMRPSRLRGSHDGATRPRAPFDDNGEALKSPSGCDEASKAPPRRFGRLVFWVPRGAAHWDALVSLDLTPLGRAELGRELQGAARARRGRPAGRRLRGVEISGRNRRRAADEGAIRGDRWREPRRQPQRTPLRGASGGVPIALASIRDIHRIHPHVVLVERGPRVEQPRPRQGPRTASTNLALLSYAPRRLAREDASDDGGVL